VRDAHLEGEMRISRGREEMRISRAALGEAARHLVRSVCGGPNRAPGPGPGPGPVGSGSVRVRGSRRAMGPAVGPGGSRAEGGGGWVGGGGVGVRGVGVRGGGGGRWGAAAAEGVRLRSRAAAPFQAELGEARE
jgi:hypothetical protein